MLDDVFLSTIEPGQATAWPVTNDEYHATDKAVGSSMLACFRKSPPRYRDIYVDHSIEKNPPTPDMEFGSMVHTLVLEPEQFDQEYAMEPTGPRRTNADKQAFAMWQLAHRDKRQISREAQKEVCEARAMAEIVRTHPIAGLFLRAEGEVETGILWRDPVTQILCKAMPDKLVTGFGALCDFSLKTAADPRPEKFAWEVDRRDYDLQSALYRHAIEALCGRVATTLLCVVGKDDFAGMVWCRVMPPGWIELGRRKLRDALCRLQICTETGDWIAPGQNELSDLEIPHTLQRQLEAR